MSTRKRFPGCVRCQERHVKCDRGKPSCSTCRNLKYPAVCEYASKKLRGFRQSRFSFTSPVTGRTRRQEDHARPASSASNDLGFASDGGTHPISPILPDNRHIGGSGSVRTSPSSPTSAIRRIYDLNQCSPSPPSETRASHRSFNLGIPSINLGPEQSPDDIYRPNTSVDLSQPRANFEIAHVSPNDIARETMRSPSCTLTDETESNIFAFYVEQAGKWVCPFTRNFTLVDSFTDKTMLQRLTLGLRKDIFIHTYHNWL